MTMHLYRLSLLTFAAASLFAACGDDDDAPAGGNNPGIGTETLYEESTVDVTGGSGTTTLVTVTDRGEGTGTTTWTNDRTYLLDGLVFVNEGQTLTIEEGTVIKANPGQGESSSALIVARGGRIDAEGTAALPIILTSVSDNSFSTPDGLVQATNLSVADNGLWGGLIVLGRAGLNSAANQTAIEGIVSTNERGLYGGDDDDDSGTLRYVSIRHGGTLLGGENEINGLTFGGVGAGTTVEYVEVFANQDDGIEFFGGTVDTRYVVSAYCQDDAFDYDEGYRGRNQFWLAYQRGASDRGGEFDGGTDPEAGMPFATPTIANATFFGVGSDDPANTRAITLRDNAGGRFYNSIFTGYGRGVDVEYLGEELQDSYDRLLGGDLEFRNNILWDIADEPFTVSAPDDVSVPQAVTDTVSLYFSNNNNTTATDPGFGADGLTPTAGGAAEADLLDLPDGFFDEVDYKGAIDPDDGPSWIQGWTRLSAELQ